MARNCITDEEDALTRSLVGRTIVSAEVRDDCNGVDWCEHQYYLLTLDDGRVVRFRGWGFDAKAWSVYANLLKEGA